MELLPNKAPLERITLPSSGSFLNFEKKDMGDIVHKKREPETRGSNGFLRDLCGICGERDSIIQEYLRRQNIFRPASFGFVPLDQVANPLTQVDLWIPAEHLAGFGHVCLVHEHIRQVGRTVLHIGFFASQVFDQFNETVNGNHFMPAEVDNFITQRLERGDRPAGDIIHVGNPRD